jgi:HlyD family secretion protein
VSLQLALLVVAIGGYGAWRRPTLIDPSQDASRVICSGNIEAHESVLSVTQVRAPIVYLPFDEGAYVKRDTVLPRLVDSPYRQQTEIDRSDLDVATAQISANGNTLAAPQTPSRQQPVRPSKAVAVQARVLPFTAERQSAPTLAHEQAMHS